MPFTKTAAKPRQRSKAVGTDWKTTLNTDSEYISAIELEKSGTKALAEVDQRIAELKGKLRPAQQVADAEIAQAERERGQLKQRRARLALESHTVADLLQSPFASKKKTAAIHEVLDKLVG